MSDNLFHPGPRPSESLANPTKHNWACGGGYLANCCCNCGIDDYDSTAVSTDFCEDVPWAKLMRKFLDHEDKLKATRRHEATEAAIVHARSVLSAEQWELLGIKAAPYRDIDVIRVGEKP